MDDVFLVVEPACKNGIKTFYVNGQQRVTPTPGTFGNNQYLIKMPQVSDVQKNQTLNISIHLPLMTLTLRTR